MRVVSRESHRHGLELLRRKNLEAELSAVLENSTLRLRTGETKQLKAALATQLRSRGWATGVRVDAELGVAVNGLKDKVAIQVQLGNMARAFYDLMKLQSLHHQGRAECAVLVLSTQSAARRLGTNHASYERITQELGSIFFEQITVPIAVLGVE